MQGTAVSDAVNQAQRVERLTKMYGVSLVVTSDVLFGLPNPTDYHFPFLDKVRVRGREKAVSVFEVFDEESPDLMVRKIQTRESFELGNLICSLPSL